MSFYSKTGKKLSLIFLIFIIGVFIYAATCGSWFCSTWLLMPGIPWIFMFGFSFANTLPSQNLQIFSALAASILLNSLTIYFIGYVIDKLKLKR